MYIPMGTQLTLISRTQVSTKDSKAGDRIYFTVAETMSFRGQVVIPAGSVAVGEVARSDRNGHLGKKGKIDVNLLYVETPNGPVRLSGGAERTQGVSGLIPSVATIVLVSPTGLSDPRYQRATSRLAPRSRRIWRRTFASPRPRQPRSVAAIRGHSPTRCARMLPASFDEAHPARPVQTAQR